tara:strand:+ start:643 stop:861 length:219 start_codon:yes stop_codon:yes gene_type:complete
MTRETYLYDGSYKVIFEYELGYRGDYNNAPEPHTVNILSIIDTYDAKQIDWFSEYRMVDAIENELHELLNDY